MADRDSHLFQVGLAETLAAADVIEAGLQAKRVSGDKQWQLIRSV